jgi:hypothetical protein
MYLNIKNKNMALKPQSIRKGVKITLNGKEAEKQEIIELSSTWNEKQVNFFKKLLQQGGATKINGNSFIITPQDKVVDSTGNKDQGIIVAPGLDEKF